MINPKRLCSYLFIMSLPASARTRLCKNCKYFMNDVFFLPFAGLGYGKCRHAQASSAVDVMDVIDGSRVESFARVERNLYGKCGVEGRLYERETDSSQRLRNCYAAPAYGLTLLAGGVLYALARIPASC